MGIVYDDLGVGGTKHCNGKVLSCEEPGVLEELSYTKELIQASTDFTEKSEEDEIRYEGPQREKQLLDGLREILQNPPPRLFKEDLTWIPIQTQSGGRYFLNDVVVISWIRLEDFTIGEDNDRMFPCSFMKKTLKKTTVRLFQRSQASSVSKIIK